MSRPTLSYDFNKQGGYFINNAYSPSDITNPAASTDIPTFTNSPIWLRYEAKNYNTSTKIWTDSGPRGINIPASSVGGNPTVVTKSGDGVTRICSVLKGGTGDYILIGNSQLSNNWTLFCIARYTSTTDSNRGRILQARSTNVLLGHHDKKAGCSHHNSWMTDAAVKNDFFTSNYGTDFFINSESPTAMYTNGVNRTTATPADTNLYELAINYGPYNEWAEWELIELLIYNTALSSTQVRTIETFLASYYGIITPYNIANSELTAIAYYNPNIASEYKFNNKACAKFVAANSNYIQLPGYSTELSTGISISMWFKSDGSSTWTRLFDSGNGAGDNNIIIFIHSNNLGVSAYTVNNNWAQFISVYSNCNDNLWRHLVWTISSDGLTWKIYINGSLTVTLTSANYTDATYGYQGSAPAHPKSVVRKYNYLGKSNWADPYLTGAISDFNFFNYCIDQTKVTSLYSSQNTNTNPNNSSSQHGGYTINNAIYTNPPGSIIAYFGSSSPDGWEIMNGQTRTVTDGRYLRLYNMFSLYSSIGTVSSDGNTFTPKDLRGAFLRGNGSRAGFPTSFLGEYQEHATITHSHTANSNDPTHSHNTYTSSNYASVGMTYYNYPNNTRDYSAGNYGRAQRYTAATAQGAKSNAIFSSIKQTTNADSGETRPFNIGVNWIIKY